jgi:diguanylate cyclase (GGDEF)-like protein/PAS domain S-box-containing protein
MSSQAPAEAAPMPWWRRLHAALMPDYNRRAAAFWWAVVTAGALALLAALWQLAGSPPATVLQLAVAAALAVSAALFPLRVPGTRTSFSASDVPLFLLLLVHGPGPAALAAAADTAVGAWRTSRRWTSRIFSPCASALSMTLCGHALQALRPSADPAGHMAAAPLLGAALAVALMHFVLNLQLVTGVLRLKRGEPLRQWLPSTLDSRWVGLATLGSASLAVLLLLVWRSSGPGVLLMLGPLVALLLVSLHFYYRQQESAEAMREAQAQAGEREAALAAQAAAEAERHVRELQASERRFHAAFTHASIGMALLAFDGRILQANPALARLLGHELPALQGTSMPSHIDDDDRAAFEACLGLNSPREFEAFAREFRCRHHDGHRVWAALHCSFFTEPDSDSPCLILQAQDVSARREAEAGLQHMAFHDALTGLPNRRRFLECLQGAVARNRTAPAVPFAVMFLDCDRFKLVNDSLGHAAGDELLVQVARRIQGRLRPHDIVARLGGDEFAILADRIEHEPAAVALAERVMDALRQPLRLAGTEVVVGASIGITFSAFGYTDADAMLRDADTAMYKAKGDGRARCALFDSGLHAAVSDRLRLEGELRRAIDDGALGVQYQPLFELDQGRLAGFEALVRWPHPRDGLLAPDRFLPMAEESQQMERLTDFVLHCACRQLRQWQVSNPALAGLGISVNVSGADLASPAFVARVSRALVESGLPAQQLTLELTENILMARYDEASRTLAALRQLGVHIALDDFGTGYSSLSHLAQLPIDSLKIDRSFVSQLAPGADQAAVVAAIIQLGQTLRKGVVAEGIESADQAQQLRALGCHFGQGYHLGTPLTAEAAGAWLQTRGATLH